MGRVAPAGGRVGQGSRIPTDRGRLRQFGRGLAAEGVAPARRHLRQWPHHEAALGGAGGLGGTATVDEEESREAVFHRLEALGYRVGLGIVER